MEKECYSKIKFSEMITEEEFNTFKLSFENNIKLAMEGIIDSKDAKILVEDTLQSRVEKNFSHENEIDQDEFGD